MNWISNVVPPKIRSLLRRDTPENLVGQMPRERASSSSTRTSRPTSWWCRAPATTWASRRARGSQRAIRRRRIRSDRLAGSSADPLKFRDIKRYADRLKEHRAKTGSPDAIAARHRPARGPGSRHRRAGFRFPGRHARHGRRRGHRRRHDRRGGRARAPFVIFTASGGARMQEGMFSLMQMARTTVGGAAAARGALALHRRADQSDHRRRHRVLCDAGRHADRRARRGHRLRRRAGHRADRARAPARRVSSAPNTCRSTAWSTWSCPRTRCARRWRGSAGARQGARASVLNLDRERGH